MLSLIENEIVFILGKTGLNTDNVFMLFNF
jgi:hypothetical protein